MHYSTTNKLVGSVAFFVVVVDRLIKCSLTVKLAIDKLLLWSSQLSWAATSVTEGTRLMAPPVTSIEGLPESTRVAA